MCDSAGNGAMSEKKSTTDDELGKDSGKTGDGATSNEIKCVAGATTTCGLESDGVGTKARQTRRVVEFTIRLYI